MEYRLLLEKIAKLEEKYQVKRLAKTYFSRQIFAVERKLSESFPTAILVASTHAREHITTDLLCKMLEDGVFDEITGFNVCVIPMLNPDGVELCINGLQSAPENCHEMLAQANGGNLDFSLWKANGRGVDINNNFDANFGTNTSKNMPSFSGFAGEFPESEIETHTLANYTRNQNVFFALSYHSKGEEIYFNFFQDNLRLERDSQIADVFARSTGYKIQNVEQTSSGGYKDFCVQSLHIPALTIEVGSDSLIHPIGSEHLAEIYQKNKGIAGCLNSAYEIYKRFQLSAD